ncbi:MAG: DUF503 domain-containing protein [Actinomycetota bacterium]
MFVGYARFDLRLPGCTSLKEKRSVVRALQTRLSKFRCAFAEIESNDMHQRATIGVSIVAGSTFHARRVLDEIERAVESAAGVELIGGLSDVIGAEDA